MAAVGVGADVVEPHVRGGLLGVRLEEDGLSVATPGARVVLRPRHGGVLGHVRVDVGDLVDLVCDPVDVNAAGVG